MFLPVTEKWLIGLELDSMENDENMDWEHESSESVDKYEYRNIPNDVLGDPIRLVHIVLSCRLIFKTVHILMLINLMMLKQKVERKASFFQ